MIANNAKLLITHIGSTMIEPHFNSNVPSTRRRYLSCIQVGEEPSISIAVNRTSFVVFDPKDAKVVGGKNSQYTNHERAKGRSYLYDINKRSIILVDTQTYGIT